MGPAPKGDQGGWQPCFPGELASSVTPSLTKKSSLPKIPQAAGKRKKGQHEVGVRGLNQLVHKNCLITGMMRKSLLLRAADPRGWVAEKHASELLTRSRPQAPAAEKMP